MLATEAGAAGGIIALAALDRETSRLQPWIALTDGEELKRQFVDQSLIYYRLVIERRLADARARRLMQDEFPALSIRGLVERREDSHFFDLEGGGSIALVLDVPLFTGGTLISNYRAQDKAQQVALVKVTDSIRRTVFSLEDSRKLIVNLQRLLDKQKIHLGQQEEIVRLSVKSYALQRTSMQDLLTSWNTLIASKNNLMQTVTDLGTLLRKYAFELGLPVEADDSPAGKKR
jgi:outer membrane protein TolC